MDQLQLLTGIGIAIFSLGVLGFLTRRSGIIALMCLELMLNGVNLCLVSFSRQHASADGSALVMLIILVAAAEAALALALFVALFRQNGSVELDDYRMLKG
ncbi:NADH-quinone oxidoreductase subunit NuoK [bacterium]|nr:NADH-quinone oxidoreductase subunit NuoK [bacterium]